MKLKLTEHVWITIFLLNRQRIQWNFDIYGKILNFRLFSGPTCFMTSNLRNALTDLYSFWYVWIEKRSIPIYWYQNQVHMGFPLHPLFRRVTKNTLVRRGLISLLTWFTIFWLHYAMWQCLQKLHVFPSPSLQHYDDSYIRASNTF